MEGRILVADDELKILRLVRTYLEAAGFEVLLASTGTEALAIFVAERPDLVVLDLMLPGLDGLEVLARIRQMSPAPVILLTARGDESDKIAGLEVGADDYVVKPFSPKELTARVRAVLRRVAVYDAELPPSTKSLLEIGLLEMDIRSRTAFWSDKALVLSALQFDLLWCLASEPERVFTRSQLVETLQGGSGEAYERTIDAHMKNLRKILGDDARSPRVLVTVRGVGYKFTLLQQPK